MKLHSWNVNGLRAILRKGFKQEYLHVEKPDILCLQEIKAQKDQVEADFSPYYVYGNSAERKGYSGTLTLTKEKPLSVSKGIGEDVFDSEGRVLNLEFPNFYLVNVYSPNSQDLLRRLDERMVFEDLFRKYLNDLKAKKPVIVCGDLNVAHKEIDLKNPSTNRRSAGFPMKSARSSRSCWTAASSILSVTFIPTLKTPTLGGAIVPEHANATQAGELTIS